MSQTDFRYESSPDRWKILLPVALFAAGFYALCFFPGAMSFDSAVVWMQARGAASDNIHGVGLLALWRLTETAWSGPAPIFLLQLALFWTGLILIARALPWSNGLRSLFMLLVAASPVVFVLSAHVWTDVALLALLTFASGALLRFRDAAPGGSARSAWALAFVAAILFAPNLRHNALPAAIPLIVCFTYLWRKQCAVPGSYSTLRTLGFAATLVLLVAATAAWLDRQVDRQLSVFPATTLWDLSALSIASDEMLLPPAAHSADLTLEDLRGAYVPYNNVPIFGETHYRVMSPFFRADDPRNSLVRDAWLAAIVDRPGAYLAHRWHLTQALFGSKPRAWPHELIYVDAEVQLGSNPLVAANRSVLHDAVMKVAEDWRDTALLAAWPYLLLAAGAGLLAWHRRSQPNARAALSVLFSGLLYAAPLPLVAPSAELRYLGWTCVCALLGTALALGAKPAARLTPAASA